MSIAEATRATDTAAEPRQPEKLHVIFAAFLRLGLTSFGGPIAHLGYFRGEFVQKRRWLDEGAYADLVALCQFLPGPASSQVGAALGLMRGGVPGAMAAWAGFTLPSAIALILFGLGVTELGALDAGWLHGLKLVAVAVVAQALVGMATKLCPDWPRRLFALAAAAAVTWSPRLTLAQIGVIVAGACFGAVAVKGPVRADFSAPRAPRVGRRAGAVALAAYALLLFGLPFAAAIGGGVDLFARFYHAGALVFGGGHVVLPLLSAEVVPRLMSNDVFLAGYGAAQAVPGPLFTLAAYLGTVGGGGWLGGFLALAGIFLPGVLLIVGVMPYWDGLRRRRWMPAAMRGVNAAVVGILLAAFYRPVCTSAILHFTDVLVAGAAFAALVKWKAPPWAVVIACAVVGEVLAKVL